MQKNSFAWQSDDVPEAGCGLRHAPCPPSRATSRAMIDERCGGKARVWGSRTDLVISAVISGAHCEFDRSALLCYS